MFFSPLIEQLINKLRCMPGVGPKTAQRMAFYLLQHGRQEGKDLANALYHAMNEVRHCTQCRNFSEQPTCHICSNSSRNRQLLCVVETPVDVLAIEQTGAFRGYYFVLMGRLSPLDGIGPKELGITYLIQLINEINPQEIILATNSTVEGEATAHYLAELLKEHSLKISRIAHGVPLGGELEFVDGNTLSTALRNREVVKSLRNTNPKMTQEQQTLLS